MSVFKILLSLFIICLIIVVHEFAGREINIPGRAIEVSV